MHMRAQLRVIGAEEGNEVHSSRGHKLEA